jgi:hypothetical protein
VRVPFEGWLIEIKLGQVLFPLPILSPGCSVIWVPEQYRFQMRKSDKLFFPPGGIQIFEELKQSLTSSHHLFILLVPRQIENRISRDSRRMNSTLQCLLLVTLLAGISAVWATSVCPGVATPPNLSVLTEPEGMIALPEYSNNNNCTWTVQCPAGSVFTVTNLTMDTEALYDYLSFGYCLIADSRRFSGIKENGGLVTNTSSLQVQFLSDSSGVKKGFWLHYRCIVPTCTDSTFSPLAVNCSQPIPCEPSSNGITTTELIVVNNYFCLADSYERTVQVIHNNTSDQILQYYSWRSSPANAVMATIPPGGETVYYTAAPVTSYSYLLEYQCSRHVCDSANGSNVVFSSMRGQLISDTDGAGANPMNNEDMCIWRIQCPPRCHRLLPADSPQQCVRLHLPQGVQRQC